MEFNPTDAGDRGGFSLLPEGLYDIEVVEAEERSSKSGNQMIALTIEVRHPRWLSQPGVGLSSLNTCGDIQDQAVL